ncbi:MAG: FecR domain-containing protein [Bacteroidales bacterium]|nr:FecR domain-containing protein [Bacteroidales bacterium]MCF8389938.1 FecR domain-containing protein [Bacteroidales bacterium]
MNISPNELKLIKTYFAGKATVEEIIKAEIFLLNPENDSKIEFCLHEIWDEIESEGNNISPYLKNQYHSILNRLINREEKQTIELNSESKLRKIYLSFARIAAILIFPILIFSVYQLKQSINFSQQKSTFTELTVPSGSRLKTELPDGSVVWLNGGSSIKYPLAFSNKSRSVEFSGEGFFEIARNEKSPFIVNTDQISVRVLGTKFNLSSYPNDNKISTALVEGKVEILRRFKTGRNNPVNLIPKQIYSLDRSTLKYKVEKEENMDKYVAWVEGRLIFDDDPMLDVLSKIEKWYNVNISYPKADLEGLNFTATFETETLDQVLDLISLAIPVEYTVGEWHKNPDNSYAKKTYILKIRKDFPKN